MYSPKIYEDLIPVLYNIGRERNKPMTHIVDEILRSYIRLKKENISESHEGLLEKLYDSLENDET